MPGRYRVTVVSGQPALDDPDEPLRAEHGELLEHKGGMVEDILFDAVLEVHTDLARGQQFGRLDGLHHLGPIGFRQELLGSKHAHLKEMSGAFSVPSLASK